MRKMRAEIIGLKLPLIKPGDNLVDLIVDAANTQAGGFRDRDVLVITSKIVSITEGYILDLNSVKPSKKAMKIAGRLHMDPRFVQLILDLSDEILFVIPFRELVERGIVDLRKITGELSHAKEAVNRIPYVFVVSRGRQIYSDASIDFSNSPPNKVTYLPKNPDKIAREIREKIKQMTGKDIAVIISDTEIMFPYGSLDFARGASGISVISKNFGAPDLFGEPKFGGVDFIVHEIAAAAALVMGQTNEKIPAVIIRGLEYEVSDEGVESIHLDPRKLRRAIRSTLLATMKIVGIRGLVRKLLNT